MHCTASIYKNLHQTTELCALIYASAKLWRNFSVHFHFHSCTSALKLLRFSLSCANRRGREGNIMHISFNTAFNEAHWEEKWCMCVATKHKSYVMHAAIKIMSTIKIAEFIVVSAVLVGCGYPKNVLEVSLNSFVDLILEQEKKSDQARFQGFHRLHKNEVTFVQENSEKIEPLSIIAAWCWQ